MQVRVDWLVDMVSEYSGRPNASDMIKLSWHKKIQRHYIYLLKFDAFFSRQMRSIVDSNSILASEEFWSKKGIVPSKHSYKFTPSYKSYIHF